MNPQAAIDSYCEANRKSPGLAFFLALMLGPLGALYASPVGGTVLLLAALLGALSSGAVIPVLVWFISAAFAPIAASAHNDRIAATAQLLAAGRTDAA